MAKADGQIYVATESFSAEIDGVPQMIHKNVTRVREGHPLLKGRESLFKPIDETVHYEWERATAAPGEKRGEPSEKQEKSEKKEK